MEVSRLFFANLSEFDSMMQWVRGHLRALVKDSSFIKQFELAVEEALVNIITYAYSHPPGSIKISYAFEKESGKISITLQDEGVPFNPLEVSEPIKKNQLEECTEGGFGIFFMRKMTDSILYERVGESNVLVLTKQL
ncbi:MAG: ATP-binding protein [Verrucomicrobia bacterium]|nr:ATP-binding protein [Verrucomicrobiota bacterium]